MRTQDKYGHALEFRNGWITIYGAAGSPVVSYYPTEDEAIQLATALIQATSTTQDMHSVTPPEALRYAINLIRHASTSPRIRPYP
jgi:hypothetical protein